MKIPALTTQQMIDVDTLMIKDVPAHQFRILEALGLENEVAPDLKTADLVLDALIGYGLAGNARGPVAAWIERINDSSRPVLALDAPSGLNTTTGVPGTPCIRATATLTLALPKTGLFTPEAQPFVGDLYLADISVPPELYRRLGLEIPPLFTSDSILKIS